MKNIFLNSATLFLTLILCLGSLDIQASGRGNQLGPFFVKNITNFLAKDKCGAKIFENKQILAEVFTGSKIIEITYKDEVKENFLSKISGGILGNSHPLHGPSKIIVRALEIVTENQSDKSTKSFSLECIRYY